MNPQLVWFAARGAGVVSLLFTTAVVYLGILSILRWRTAAWPPFATAGFHENLALFTVSFLGIHIASAVLDPYLSLGFVAGLVPFASPYRTLWMAFGTVAFYLVGALVLTSLLRNRIGVQTWRLIHWAAYAPWPFAMLHALGTGTDATSPWMLAIMAACAIAVGGATFVRFTNGRPVAAPMRRGPLPGPPAPGTLKPPGPPAPGTLKPPDPRRPT